MVINYHSNADPMKDQDKKNIIDLNINHINQVNM